MNRGRVSIAALILGLAACSPPVANDAGDASSDTTSDIHSSDIVSTDIGDGVDATDDPVTADVPDADPFAACAMHLDRPDELLRPPTDRLPCEFFPPRP